MDLIGGKSQESKRILFLDDMILRAKSMLSQCEGKVKGIATNGLVKQ